MKHVLGKTSFQLIPFYFAQYVTQCFYQNFITVYLNDRGVDSAGIGLLMAVAPLVSLLGQPVWGNLGDRIPWKNTLLWLLCLLGSLSICLLPFTSGLLGMGAILALFAFFYLSVQPLGDAVALESLHRAELPYGPVRLFASLSFGLFSALSGLLLTGHSERVPWAIAVSLLLTFSSVFLLPKVRGHRERSDKGGIRGLRPYKRMWTLIVFSMLLMIGLSSFYNFFPIFYKVDLGGTQNMLGVCFLISSFVEIPFLAYYDRLYRRFGAEKLLLFSGLVMAFRWLLLSLIRNPWVAMATQALHIGCFLLMSLTVIFYVDETVPAKYKAAGQMVYTLTALSIARILGALIGGFLAQRFGRRELFLITSVYTFVCVFAFSAWLLLRKRRENTAKTA